MVLNTGGNKAKKFARKVISAPEKGTRFIEEKGEMYAIVLKLLGNNICEVLCIDGEIRQCVIRKKFSGKGKRDNLLSKGKWILVGLRSWEVTRKEKEKCDLLEVYSDNNRETLIKRTNEDFKPFLSVMCEEGEINTDYIEFINSKEISISELSETKIDNSKSTNIYLDNNISDSNDSEENNELWYDDNDEKSLSKEINLENLETMENIKSITDNMKIINIDDI